MRHDRRLAILLVLVATLITAYAMPAVAGSHDDTPGDDYDDGSDDASDNGEGDPPEDPQENRGRAPAGVGHVSRTDGAFDGRFIDGELTDDGLANLSYDGTMLFDGIHVHNLTITETRIDGARIEIRGETADGDARFRLHDTATAFARYEVDDDGDLSFDLADGAEVFQAERGYKLTHDDVTVRIWIEDGDLSLANGTLSSDGEVEVKMLVSPSAVPAGDNVDKEVAEAAARGRVGAEVRMSRDDGAMRSEVAHLSNMSVLGSRSRDGVVLVVSSDDPTGRTVVLHLDDSVFGGNGTGDLEVRFDGEPIGQADDLQDVLDAADDEDPEYVLVQGADQVQVLVAIPSFSPHTIEVASLPGNIIAQTGLSLTQAAMAAVAAAATVAVAAGVAGKR